MRDIRWLGLGMLLVGFFFSTAAQALTKDEVQKRGYLQCGVSAGTPGFSVADEKGSWTGMDVDICRGIAAAVLGDSTKIKFIPLSDEEQFGALQTGDVDILVKNSSWTFVFDSSLALNFAGIYLYDTQGLLVPEKMGVKEGADLDGVQLCVLPGSVHEEMLTDYFSSRKLEYKPVFFNSFSDALKGYKEGKCEVLTHKKSILAGLLPQLKSINESIILPDSICREPLSPVVRQGDDSWYNIVKWTLFLMINSEEEGISSINIDQLKVKLEPEGKERTGVFGALGTGLGLSDDWAYKVIKQVGNYGEIFKRNLGSGSELKMERGPNRLWSDGGLLYAPPLR